jgi:hypothetical protein
MMSEGIVRIAESGSSSRCLMPDFARQTVGLPRIVKGGSTFEPDGFSRLFPWP